MRPEKCLQEVTVRCQARHKELLKRGKTKSFAHYNSTLPGLGLPVPVQRELFRTPYSFSSADERSLLKIWDHVWMKGRFIEVMNQPLFAYHSKTAPERLLKAWPVLKRWSARIENWAHSDSLSSVYARLLELDQNLVYPLLKKWNRSKNPWLRRQSIVSLLYYRAGRSRVLPLTKMLPLVENLLRDEDYYVQKGVGWTLREIGNEYPAEHLAFLRKNVAVLAPPAYSAAVEKLSSSEKAKLMKQRTDTRR